VRFIYLLLPFVIFMAPLFATLPQTMVDAIAKDKIDPKNLSIVVQDLSSGTVIASLNPTTPRVPASVEKIATAYAILLELGPDFKWPTQLYYRGTLKSGVLHGDIIVKGYGDPTLRAKDVKEFAKKIASFGVRKIVGNIVIDRTFFKNSPKISSGFDKNFLSEYNAMPDALMYNDHLNYIQIAPKNGVITAQALYSDKSFHLLNKIKPTSGACRGKNAWPKVRYDKKPERVDVILEGSLSKRCRKITLHNVLSKPYSSFYYSFKSYLKSFGVEVNGALKLGRVPKDAKLLITHYSEPLQKIVAKTLKKSNNLYARHLFLALAAKRYGYPATVENAERAVRDILGPKGVLSAGDFIDNGCGLSIRSRMSPMTAIKINRSAYRDFGKMWLDSLSIAGVDGTLKKRFAHSIVKKHAFMKTGTLKKAKNIAGFVKTKSGRLLNVAIFYNGAKIWLGSDIQNKIITMLVKE
jgi:D-alanyl-D-alanine carboxypeptidase/D-alanyl-D-alanine-endopeptidase (penicillin-binding protein 4)